MELKENVCFSGKQKHGWPRPTEVFKGDSPFWSPTSWAHEGQERGRKGRGERHEMPHTCIIHNTVKFVLLTLWIFSSLLLLMVLRMAAWMRCVVTLLICMLPALSIPCNCQSTWMSVCVSAPLRLIISETKGVVCCWQLIGKCQRGFKQLCNRLRHMTRVLVRIWWSFNIMFSKLCIYCIGSTRTVLSMMALYVDV